MIGLPIMKDLIKENRTDREIGRERFAARRSAKPSALGRSAKAATSASLYPILFFLGL
jgi:hypothetical protein